MIKPTAHTLGSWEMFPGHFGAAHPRVHIKQLRGAFFVCHQESGFGQCIDAEGLVYALRDGSFGVPDSSSHRPMRFFLQRCAFQKFAEMFMVAT